MTDWLGEGQLDEIHSEQDLVRELKDQSGPEEGWEAAKMWG